MINFDPSQLSPGYRGPYGSADQSAGTRRFYELMPGDRFKAMILDIRPGQVTIRLDGGGTFTARSMVLPEARIGEDALFIVKENDTKGHILLEMGKLTPGARQDNMLREALGHAGMHVNEETLNLGRAMLNNNLPVDAGSLQKAALYHFTLTDGAVTPLDGVIFLLKENFPADQNLINAFNRVVTQPGKLLANINRIVDEILSAPPEQASTLLKALFPEGDASGEIKGEKAASVREWARGKFLLPLYAAKSTLLHPGKNDPQQTGGNDRQLAEYFKKLHGTFERVAETAAARDIGGSIQETAAESRNLLQMMQRIDVHREYYQIPFAVNPREPARQSELFIFKDKKTGGAPNKTYSALISLDTAGLKHTEVYIQKTGGQAFLTFRCDTERALGVISAAGNRLTQLLKEKNISVGNMAFNKITEPFALTDPEPYAEPPKQESAKRFAFDMRV